MTKRHRDDEIPEIPMLGAIMRCARWHREWHICLIPLPGEKRRAWKDDREEMQRGEFLPCETKTQGKFPYVTDPRKIFFFKNTQKLCNMHNI